MIVMSRDIAPFIGVIIPLAHFVRPFNNSIYKWSPGPPWLHVFFMVLFSKSKWGTLEIPVTSDHFVEKPNIYTHPLKLTWILPKWWFRKGGLPFKFGHSWYLYLNFWCVIASMGFRKHQSWRHRKHPNPYPFGNSSTQLGSDGWGYVIVPSRVWILFKGFSMQRWVGWCSYQLIPGHPLSGLN